MSLFKSILFNAFSESYFDLGLVEYFPFLSVERKLSNLCFNFFLFVFLNIKILGPKEDIYRNSFLTYFFYQIINKLII